MLERLTPGGSPSQRFPKDPVLVFSETEYTHMKGSFRLCDPIDALPVALASRKLFGQVVGYGGVFTVEPFWDDARDTIAQ